MITAEVYIARMVKAKRTREEMFFSLGASEESLSADCPIGIDERRVCERVSRHLQKRKETQVPFDTWVVGYQAE